MWLRNKSDFSFGFLVLHETDTIFFFRLAQRHGSRRFHHNRCVDSTLALQFLQGNVHPLPLVEHQLPVENPRRCSSFLLPFCYLKYKKADADYDANQHADYDAYYVARREYEPLAVSGALHENLLPLAMPRRYASILLPALLS